jgi:hypothetical protein
VRADISYTLGAEVERLLLNGTVDPTAPAMRSAVASTAMPARTASRAAAATTS